MIKVADTEKLTVYLKADDVATNWVAVEGQGVELVPVVTPLTGRAGVWSFVVSKSFDASAAGNMFKAGVVFEEELEFADVAAFGTAIAAITPGSTETDVTIKAATADTGAKFTVKVDNDDATKVLVTPTADVTQPTVGQDDANLGNVKVELSNGLTFYVPVVLNAATS